MAGSPQAPQVFDLCALGLLLVKAYGLVVVYDHALAPRQEKNPINPSNPPTDHVIGLLGRQPD